MIYISELHLLKKKRESRYLFQNYIYLRVKGHLVSAYLDSGELLIAEDMETLKLSLPFLLQNIFTKRGGLMVKYL